MSKVQIKAKIEHITIDLHRVGEKRLTKENMDLLRLYTKPNCHLCHQVREWLEESGMDWEEMNIQTDPELMMLYGHDVPVVRSDRGVWLYKDKDIVPLTHWLKTFVR